MRLHFSLNILQKEEGVSSRQMFSCKQDTTEPFHKKSGSRRADCRIPGISQPTARTSCIQQEFVSLQAKTGENVSQLSCFHLHHISSKSQAGSQQSSTGSLASADLNPEC